MTLYLLLILWMSPEGQLDIKHLGSFSSKQHCEEQAQATAELQPPEGTRFHCLATDKTKGMVT